MKIAALLWLLIPAHAAHAGNWQVCRLQATVTRVIKTPYPEIQARIDSVVPLSAEAQCPGKHDVIQFLPETRDYQNTLPRKQWPKAGQQVKLRYQYLDGICKNDGNSAPCRIKHYPMGW